MELTNLNNAKLNIMNSIAIAAKKNLDEPSDRLIIKSKWDKLANGDWKPISSVKTTKKRKISNTGRLSASIKYKIVGSNLSISTLAYGEAIDLGRKKGDYAPENDIDKWAKQRGIKGAGFMVNRKIKFFGMPATNFLTGPVEEMVDKMPEILAEAFMKDLDEMLKNN